MKLKLAVSCLTVLLISGCVSSGSQYSSPVSKPRPSKTYAEITKGINAIVAEDTVSASYNFQAANQIMNNTVANHPDDYYWNHWYLDHAYAKALLAQSYLERGMALPARSLFLEIPDVIRNGQSQYGRRVQERNNDQQDIATAMAFVTAGLGVAAAAQGVPAATVQQTMMPMFDLIELAAEPVEAFQLDNAAPTSVETDVIRMPAFFNYGTMSTIGRLYNKGSCTAFFIRPAVVATNAHCLTNNDGEWDIDWNTLRVEYSWLNDRNAMFKGISSETITFKHAYKSPKYTGDGDFRNDWALLVAQRPHPNGYFGYSFGDLEPGAQIAIPGHSSDLNQGRYITMDYGCRVTNADDAYEYQCATFKGSSGSPILELQENGEIGLRVMGIHACGQSLTRSESKNYGRRTGCGARFGSDFFETLDDIEAAYPGST